VTDLLSWLRSALDLQAEIARAATPGPWRQGSITEFGTADVHALNDRVTAAYSEPCCAAEDALHIAYNDPIMALRTVAAHREILDRHAPRPIINGSSEPRGVECSVCVADVNFWVDSIDYEDWPCADVRSLAAIYRESHPGFDPSWIGES
jgi:hypothetical protein